MAGKFVLKPSGDQFMFNLLAGNHQIVLTSERYTTKTAALNGIESVKKNAADDNRFDFSDDGLRFSLKAGNGQVIGISETYSSAAAAKAGAEAVQRAAEGAETEEAEG